MPLSPPSVYRRDKSWKGWPDFFGKVEYYSLEEAKQILKKFNFRSYDEFKDKFNFKKYPRIPRRPERVYRDRLKTWHGMSDFLGKK